MKHMIPVASASPVLVSNGSEKILPYHLSNDFCVVAKADGKVISNNQKTGVIVIEYNELINGKKRYVINSNTKVVKNGAGGFYLTNKLNCDELKPGFRFKKNDVLAYNDKFFSKSNMEGVRFNIGTLVKAACCSTYSSFEDGNFVTEKLSTKLGAEICMETETVIGKNSNVSYIVSIGDEVNIGDPLIIFDNSSNDESFNKMLKNIGTELKEEITLLGKTPIKAKYAGVIQDIKIYATVKTSEMSSSLKKVVEDYYSRIRAQENDIKKNAGSDPNLAFTETTDIIENEDGKIMGVTVGEGVLIKFFIKYIDKHSIGDKLVNFTAMKYVTAEMIKPGLEPYSLDNPDEEISTLIAPGGILGRMTPSIFTTMYANKIIVELKRKWLEMYKKDNPSFKPKDDLY